MLNLTLQYNLDEMWGSEYGTNPVINWSTVQMPGTLTPGITIADILKTSP